MSGSDPSPDDPAASGGVRPSLELPAPFRRRRTTAADPPPSPVDRPTEYAAPPPPPVPAREPVEETQPVEPIQPIEPGEPGEPGPPIEPVEPVPPIEPVEPVQPIEPVPPIEPAGPVGPVTPPTPSAVAAAEPAESPSPAVVEPAEPSAPRRPPILAPTRAALATGLVVGGVIAGLGWLALRGCASLRGTTSCGNPGLLVYLAIFVVAVVLGRLLLMSQRVAEPGSTSLLAVAVLAVLALVATTVSVGGWAAVVAFILGGAACFWLAQRVTATFTEPGDRLR